ncbi:MAG TPA: hypothetical protein VF756_30710 [Thermoanaerobaculia bacterium]
MSRRFAVNSSPLILLGRWDIDQFLFGCYSKNSQRAGHSQVPPESLGSPRDLIDQEQISLQEVREHNRFSFAEIQTTSNEL